MRKKVSKQDPDLEELKILIDPTDPDEWKHLNEEFYEKEDEFQKQDEELEEEDENGWCYPDEDEVDYTTGSTELKMSGLPYYL